MGSSPARLWRSPPAWPPLPPSSISSRLVRLWCCRTIATKASPVSQQLVLKESGAGVTLGYAPARIAYMGVRYIYHFGSTRPAADATGFFDVTDRTQLFGVDLGLEFPVGAMELVIGGTLGVVRFSQRVEPTGSTGESTSSDIGTGFVAAPLALLHVRVGPLMLVPQVTWYFAGDPDFRWQVDHSGPAASLAIVLPIETDRIRY